MSEAVLTINSKNYGARSLEGWLLCKFSELDFAVEVVDWEGSGTRTEPLFLSPSSLAPRLRHDQHDVWDTLAMGEYLHESLAKSPLLPADPAVRARCRSICGEIHSDFANLRSALPMNIKSHHRGSPMFAGAQADIDRIETIWNECLDASGGPYLFGEARTVADALYAPVCVRLCTYEIKVGAAASRYIETIMGMPEIREWIAAARLEPDDDEELDEMEF
jgi:glutathione S-transferase